MVKARSQHSAGFSRVEVNSVKQESIFASRWQARREGVAEAEAEARSVRWLVGRGDGDVHSCQDVLGSHAMQ